MQTFDRSLFGTLWRYALSLRARRNRMLAIRSLDSLPAALRKDIGWPDGHLETATGAEWTTPLAAAGPWSAAASARVMHRRAGDAEVVLLPASAKRRFAPAPPTRKLPVGS